jgi:hypothetical protein
VIIERYPGAIWNGTQLHRYNDGSTETVSAEPVVYQCRSWSLFVQSLRVSQPWKSVPIDCSNLSNKHHGQYAYASSWVLFMTSVDMIFAHRKAWYVASARTAFRTESSAGVTLIPVAVVFVYRLGASMDLNRALVDAIVDVDLTDMVSSPHLLSLCDRSDDVIVDSLQYILDVRFASKSYHLELRSYNMTQRTSLV